MMRDAEKTVGNMIDKLKTAFIGSIDREGFPNIKAMLQPRKREGIKTIYLTTNTSSMRVAQYRENNHACIYFCDTRFFRGAMLRGTMEVLTDSASKEMIWQEEVCRNARCTSFFVHHYTNLFTFFKLRSFEDFFDLCVPSI